MKLSDRQRNCIIAATTDRLLPFRRGFAHSKRGPFFDLRTVRSLVHSGDLRLVHEFGGNRLVFVTARAA